MTINVNCPPRGLFIGRETENVARTLDVDFSAWAAEHGPGTLQVLIQRPGDSAPYPVTITVEGTVATWKPSETDLAEAGTGAVQLVYTTAAGVREKTQIIPVMVEPSLGVESDPPEGWTSWLDQLTDLAAETEQHAASAAESAGNAADSAAGALQSATDAGSAKNAAVAAAEAAAASVAHYPQIVGGVWYVWSPTAGEYISTGIDAQGEDGVSPTVEITAIQGGHRVVITDADGPHTFDVLDGVTPDMSAYRTAADQDEIDDAQDDQIADLKSAIEDLQALSNRKAGALIDTASGAIASFVPDSTIDNLLGVSVDIEPVQDLHGYDSPWPAGGGVNKFDPAIFEENGGVLQTDGSYYLSSINQLLNKIAWDSDGYAGQIAVTLIRKCEINRQSLRLYINYTDGTYVKIGTNFATGDFDTYTLVSDASKTVSSVTFDYGSNLPTYAKIQVELGSTPTAWSPYSNECPISGWDSVEVQRTGVNLWGGTLASNVNVVFDTKPGQTYTISAKLKGTNDCYLYLNSSVDGFQTTEHVGRILIGQRVATVTFTAEAGKEYALWSNASYTEADQIQIELGSTAHDYHPYTGNRYTIALGQSVYGGTLDAVNGTMTVDRVKYSITGAETYNQFSGNKVIVLAARLPFVTKKPGQVISNLFKPVSSIANPPIGSVCVYTANGNIIFGVDTSVITDISEWTAFATENNLHVVYEIETPITIQLDPVTISTISGQTNNAWADAGDVSVEFAADLKTYIDSKIAAAVAAMS